MPRSLRLPLVGLVWLGAALRLRGLFANTFHGDEALFACWARLIAVWRDPLLRAQPVDKPPLLFYGQALFYPLFGPVEWAARLPSLIASLLLIALTAQVAWRLGGGVAALVAAAVVALAPLAVQFSATAFSDPLLTLWLTAALALVLARPGRARPGWAGVCAGLALATKYQAALFLPLLAGLGWLAGWRGREWRRAAAGLAVLLAALLLWGVARSDGAGLVARQWANVGGLRPARSWELWPRLAEMARLWWLALGGPLLLGGAAAVALALTGGRARRRWSPAAALLALFALAYTLLHWLWAVPAWDRYLLPLLPLAAALLGWAVAVLWAAAGAWPRRQRAALAAAALLLLIGLQAPVAAKARAGGYPIGGSPAADGGAAAVAVALADAPYGTVLYDHWYSWHWRYQLFDRRVYVSWFADADALLADLAAFGQTGPARFIALPRDATAAPLARRLREAGYRLTPLPGPPEATMELWRIEWVETDE